MMTRAISILLLAAGAAAAQIAVPRIGCFVDDARRLRPVLGVAGNFLIGEPEAEEVLAAVCMDNLTIVKRAESLEIRTRDGVSERSAPAGTALFQLADKGSNVLVFFPETGEWLSVSRRSVRTVEHEEMGTETLLLPNGGRLTSRGAELVLIDAAGEERTIALPGEAASLEWLGQGWVRIRLAGDEGHVAFSLDREQVYRLPEAAQ